MRVCARVLERSERRGYARVNAALTMKVEDLRPRSTGWTVRLHEKGGKQHSMPCHHALAEALRAYIDAAGIAEDRKGWLFRTARGHNGSTLSEKPMSQPDAWRMIRRRAVAAGIAEAIGCHTFRATGITAYLANGGALEHAQEMAAHESPRTTKLYDRTKERLRKGCSTQARTWDNAVVVFCGVGDASDRGLRLRRVVYSGGTTPRCSRRQLGDLAGEHGEADLVRVGGRQGDFDAGDHLGDAPGHLDQAEADRVELGVAPERCPGRQPAQAQHQPVGGGVDQEAELVGGGLGARGAVGGKVQLVRLDQVLGLPARAIYLLVERFRQAREIGDDEAAVGA